MEREKRWGRLLKWKWMDEGNKAGGVLFFRTQKWIRTGSVGG